MRVIFLDIDGVLNCSKTHNPRKLPYVIDPKLRRRFERLLEHTRAKVVLSSTWRTILPAFMAQSDRTFGSSESRRICPGSRGDTRVVERSSKGCPLCCY